MNRRETLKVCIAASLLPYLGTACTTVSSGEPLEATPEDNATLPPAGFQDTLDTHGPASPIGIIQSPNPEAVLAQVQSPGFAERLAQATYRFVADLYPSGNLPIWQKPQTEVDLLARMRLAAEAMLPAIVANAAVYPVDPVWLMGQILAESFFFEFAISSSLAVGMCQFIRTTAKEYGMVCADAPRRSEGIQLPHWQKEAERAETLRAEARAHRRAHPELFSQTEKTLRELSNRIAGGADVRSTVAAWKNAWARQDQLLAEQREATRHFRQYLEANFGNRSIFSPQDEAFLADFDQRVLPRFAVPAMVRMMARHLRARGGNILAATAGYNAGLGATETSFGIYSRYGRVPAFEETVTYVSRILIHHHEIHARLLG